MVEKEYFDEQSKIKSQQNIPNKIRHDKPTEYKIKIEAFRNLIRWIKYPKKRTNRNHVLKMMPKNSICAEIGVDTGKFSLEILKYTKPKKLFLIDSWAGQGPQGTEGYDIVTKKFKNYKNVEIINCDSVEACKRFSDYYFDWVYIDANHTYNAVKADLESYFSKVKNFGYITGDDYDPIEFFGLVKSVNEFANKYPDWRHVEFKNRQFILQKPKRDIDR